MDDESDRLCFIVKETDKWYNILIDENNATLGGTRVSGVKLFYSWQSDLPSNETRNFIQSCIDAAVKSLRDTVYIEADRDTKGEFGSPDISQIIFEKIEECDIFIADVSIVNSENYIKDAEGNFVKTKRPSPNSNVLMELGFAAGILGWDNVICIMDKDFGEVTELPFDLQHRRITPYSLNGKDKSEERKRIRDIISSTVMNLIESGPRAKKGMSLLKVGSYVDGSVSDKLIAYEPFESAFLSGKIGEYVSSCKKLISEISKVKLVHQECEEETGDPLENITKPRLKRYSKEDEEFYRELAKSELGEDLSVDFFETGGLKSQVNLIDRETVYVGTEEEKLKVEKIEEFQIQLSFLYMLDSYWKIYDELVIFPLAIENVSSTSDTEISIYVKIKNESAEIINADKKLIPEVCVGIEGLIYEHAYIKDILMMTSDNDITYDEDISYDFNDNIANFKRNNIFSLNQQTPKYDASDYEREIKKYFAPAMENSRDTYEFFIRSIRAHEKVWIGPAILLRPLKEEVELSYGIKSNKSDGSIKGTLKYVVTKE